MRVKLLIIGGGASGTLTALHQARHIGAGNILVVSPEKIPARGIAYSTSNSRHLLNVRASNMGAYADDPGHFLRWLNEKNNTPTDADAFMPRKLYGDYLEALFAAAGIAHRQQTVTALSPEDSGVRATLSDGTVLSADRAVLALGHFPPVDIPQYAPDVLESGCYRPDAWSRTFPDRALGVDEPVVLIGTGLTSIDMLLNLREQGHRGPVTMVSRHGLLSHAHTEPSSPLSPSVVPLETTATALAYLRCFRASLADRVAWRTAVDSIRPVTNALWQRLPPNEQKRFRRHLFHLWNISRHRMAPPIAAVIEREREAGTLVIRRAHVETITRSGRGAEVKLRTAEGTTLIPAGLVINCSGPDTRYDRVPSPLLNQLLRGGHIVSGAMGSALVTNDRGMVIDATGRALPCICAIGPLRAGTLFETTAIPEIRQQANALAQDTF
ncbi:FAD/NAD(P)-binding protein [Brytella acorum]|uniref:FAD/NAD(P)-binding protein n=1 Tax=Brytella acorum TaxID=2959299 RepID=A0AA35UU00_9PROT|nr:FAD/NAD(P)-binding protein [Brytella acorum]MDF3625166.1 FAD/NAD(P)-binding protein [Brytella acorum]CAI9122076.1 FAD/NAD(P)-binding protein [Brytella acorum]